MRQGTGPGNRCLAPAPARRIGRRKPRSAQHPVGRRGAQGGATHNLYSLTFYSHRRGIYTRLCPEQRALGHPPCECQTLDLIGLPASGVSARPPRGSPPPRARRSRPTPRLESGLISPGPGSGASTASQTRPFASARRQTGRPGTVRAPCGAGFAKVWFARGVRANLLARVTLKAPAPCGGGAPTRRARSAAPQASANGCSYFRQADSVAPVGPLQGILIGARGSARPRHAGGRPMIMPSSGWRPYCRSPRARARGARTARTNGPVPLILPPIADLTRVLFPR
jgi:hypothetical protein